MLTRCHTRHRRAVYEDKEKNIFDILYHMFSSKYFNLLMIYHAFLQTVFIKYTNVLFSDTEIVVPHVGHFMFLWLLKSYFGDRIIMC